MGIEMNQHPWNILNEQNEGEQDNFRIATFVMSYMYNWHNSSKSDAINGLRYHWLISYVS